MVAAKMITNSILEEEMNGFSIEQQKVFEGNLLRVYNAYWLISCMTQLS